ncbi:hypothetical protein ATCC90586_000581 [Pythium insidiosum]|nr:hypothetical protein ATCC90586_000581 [Pythium insidiosum]
MVLCCRKAETEDVPGEGHRSGLVPGSKRKCRDVLCCLLFIVYWLGMIVVAAIGLNAGQPLTLVYGRDYNGTTCGTGDMAGRQLTAFPRLDEDMLVALTHQVPLTKMPFFGVCVAACPLAGDTVCTYDNATCWTTTLDTTAVLFRCVPLDSKQNETVLAQRCLDPIGADPDCTADRFLSKACPGPVCKTREVQKNVWQVEATTPNPLLEQLQGHLQTLGRLVSDARAAAGVILLVGGGGAMLLGVVWLVVLQFFAGCMVWLTCWLVILGLILLSLFCSVRGGVIDVSGLAFLNGSDSEALKSVQDDIAAATQQLQTQGDATTRHQFEAAAYVLWVLTAIVFLLLLAMRKRIHIAIAVIRESSRAIKKMPLLLLWPVFPTVGFIVLVVYSISIAAFLMSSSNLDDVVATTAALASNATSSSLNATAPALELNELPSDTLQQVLLGYHLFGFLWTNQLLQAISICTIAGAVAQYYWTAPDASGKRRLEARFPIARALRYVLRFSLGSLCFGSFVIAFVQFLRVILEYIDRQYGFPTKELQQSNGVVKVAFLAVRCCLWCFEKCLKFLSKNAYILIAMRGVSFCSAAAASFKLLFNNIARVAVVNSISFFLLLLVKITITLAVAGAVFLALSNASASTQLQVLGSSDPITSPLAPVLIASILAWLVASAFANVYDAAIDTILLCFCEDTELNGETASDFMSDELRRIMGGGKERKVIHVAPAGATANKTVADDADDSKAPSNKVHLSLVLFSFFLEPGEVPSLFLKLNLNMSGGDDAQSNLQMQMQLQSQRAQMQHQINQLAAFWQSQVQEISQIDPNTFDFKTHQLPLARIKKIMKTDDDVRMISAEAPVLFAKACEMFILELSLRAWYHTEENKRRTLQRSDIATAISKSDVFDFLIDIVPRDDVKSAKKGPVDAQVIYQQQLQQQQAAMLQQLLQQQAQTGSSTGVWPNQQLQQQMLQQYQQRMQSMQGGMNLSATGTDGNAANGQPNGGADQLNINQRSVDV